MNAQGHRRTNTGSSLFSGKLLAAAFGLGLLFYWLADGCQTGAIPLPEGWRADFIGILLHDLSLVLWTAAAVTVFLEIRQNQRQQRTDRYLAEQEAVLDSLGYPVPNAPEGAATPDLAALTGQLETLLTAVDQLQREILALKTDVHSEDEKPTQHE